MIPNRIVFSVTFPEIPHPVEDVWSVIASNLKINRCLPKNLRLSQIAGHPENMQSEKDLVLDADGVRQTIMDRQLSGFRLDTGYSPTSIGFWLHSYPASGPQAFLNVRVEAKTRIPQNWNNLIEGIMVMWPTIGSWKYGSLYYSWQNITDPEGYENFYGIMPPNVEHFETPGTFKPRKRIRHQNAPGRRRTLVPAIDFLPSAEMWLGEHFWQYAKCTKEEAMAADFFLEVRDTPNFLYLKSWPEAFTRPDGEQGRQQQRLWKLFFNEDCEWPPGSGGISDKPMYGPPELMPKGENLPENRR